MFKYLYLVSCIFHMYLDQRDILNKYIVRHRGCLLPHLYAPKVNTTATSSELYFCALVIRVNNRLGHERYCSSIHSAPIRPLGITLADFPSQASTRRVTRKQLTKCLNNHLAQSS